MGRLNLACHAWVWQVRCFPSSCKQALTLEYRINGGGGNNRGGWKWFDITIIGGVGIIEGGD